MGFFKKIKRNVSKTVKHTVKAATSIPKGAIKSAGALVKGTLGAAGQLAKGNIGGAIKEVTKGASGAVKATVKGHLGVVKHGFKAAKASAGTALGFAHSGVTGALLGTGVQAALGKDKKNKNSTGSASSGPVGEQDDSPIKTGRRFEGYAQRRDPAEEGRETMNRLKERYSAGSSDREEFRTKVSRTEAKPKESTDFQEGLRKRLRGIA